MKICYEKQTYKVTIKDWLYISFHNMVLILKRCKRRFNIVFPNKLLILNLFITFLWILYGFIVCVFGKKFVELDYDFAKVLWEVKEGYFTSVILSSMINAINNIKQYKEKLSFQYELYCETLYDFDSMFDAFSEGENTNYIAFYYINVLEGALRKVVIDEMTEKNFLFENINVIINRIKIIEESIKQNKIISCNTVCLMGECNEAKKMMENFLIKNNIDYNDITEFSYILYTITNRLRNPWRWDIKRKIKILACLSKYPENKIKENYYYRMLLYDFNTDSLD